MFGNLKDFTKKIEFIECGKNNIFLDTGINGKHGVFERMERMASSNVPLVIEPTPDYEEPFHFVESVDDLTVVDLLYILKKMSEENLYMFWYFNQDEEPEIMDDVSLDYIADTMGRPRARLYAIGEDSLQEHGGLGFALADDENELKKLLIAEISSTEDFVSFEVKEDSEKRFWVEVTVKDEFGETSTYQEEFRIHGYFQEENN